MAQAGLELMSQMLHPPVCWDHRHTWFDCSWYHFLNCTLSLHAGALVLQGVCRSETTSPGVLVLFSLRHMEDPQQQVFGFFVFVFSQDRVFL